MSDLAPVLLLLGVVWFLTAILRHINPMTAHALSVAPSKMLAGVIPLKWVPPFPGNDWVIEEVVKEEVKYRAKCPAHLKGKFKYRDDRLRADIHISFADGVATATVVKDADVQRIH